MFKNSSILTLISIFVYGFASSQKPTFNHLAIYVADLEKSSAFYREVIGLDTMANPFRDNKHVWFVIGDKMELHMIAGATAQSEHARNNHLCFSVPSVEVFTGKLVKTGISYENLMGSKNEMTIRPDGVRQIYFTDPDGYWIEINDAKK